MKVGVDPSTPGDVFPGSWDHDESVCSVRRSTYRQAKASFARIMVLVACSLVVL
jgi:hypothetical protein